MKGDKRQLQFTQWELSALVERSIAVIKEHEPSDGYFVGFSGGKDSIVTLELVKMAGVKFVAGYNVTGIDPPEVSKMIREKYPEVQFLRPKQSFWKLLKKKPPPTWHMRWCCQKLKEGSVLGKSTLIFGIRAEESARRAKYGQISVYKKKTHVYPIYYWPEWAVWEFIDAHNLPYPSLYDNGYSRMGCIVCPFKAGTSINKQLERARSQEQYPNVWAAHKACVKYWWEHRAKKPTDRHTDFEEFYKNYWFSN